MRSTGQNFSQARLPLLHRLSHLVHVAVPVINRRDAGYRSGHVIEQFLRDVDWRAERREVCRERAAKVVNSSTAQFCIVHRAQLSVNSIRRRQ